MRTLKTRLFDKDGKIVISYRIDLDEDEFYCLVGALTTLVVREPDPKVEQLRLDFISHYHKNFLSKVADLLRRLVIY